MDRWTTFDGTYYTLWGVSGEVVGTTYDHGRAERHAEATQRMYERFAA